MKKLLIILTFISVSVICVQAVSSNSSAFVSPVIALDAEADYTDTLPLNLVSFRAELHTDYSVKLKWLVGPEQMNSAYTIERSYDGNYFMMAATADTGFPAGDMLLYSYIDEGAFVDNNQKWVYYRLKQSNPENGIVYYSEVVSVTNTSELHADPFIVKGEE